MAGAAMSQRPVSQRAMALLGAATQGALSAANINSFRVTAVVERLSTHFRPGNRSDPAEFSTLCLSLARGIDYAIATNDIPPRAQEMPSVLKQVYHRKNEPQLLAGVMVLMISVKNACKNGWFLVQDADELLTLANEMGRSFCSPAEINIQPSSLPHVISNVMSRFFPRMKIGNILISLEVKPGFGAYAVDFHILRDKISAAQEKIRLVVVQTDSVLTSSCLISPPKVNFLLNGKGVTRRTDISMDTGPQLPTNVTPVLKYGTNLLQAVGQFNGNYIIALAFMTMKTSSDVPELQDYVQPVAAALYSDSEIIEGSSRISLNCPISFTRIKTPVKGQLCRHHQCFDFENYIEINSRRPSWRCPHCNQSVCYMDIRIDQNIVKVLGEVAGNVADVVISADGSWKAVMERDDQTDGHHDMTLRDDQDGSEQCESTRSLNTLANVVDLTMEDAEENDAMGTWVTEDRKPFKDVPPGYSVVGIPVSSEISNTSEASPSHFSRIEDDFWSGIFFPCSSTFNGSAAPGISESPATNSMMTPVLTDAVSPAFNREIVDVHGASQAAASIMHNQNFAPSNLQMQSLQVMNSLVTTEFGRSVPRYVSRNPIAVQALPAQSQAPASHNRLRENYNSLMSNGSAVASQSPTIMSPPTDLVGNSEAERQHQFSRSLLNSPSAPDMSSSSMLHFSMAQNWDHQGRQYIPNPLPQVVGLPATSQVPSTYRGSSGVHSERHNSHHQPPMNVGMPQTVSQPPTVQTSTHFRPIQVQQGRAHGIGGQEAAITNSHSRLVASAHRSNQVARSPPAVPVQLQAPRSGSSFPMTADGFRASVAEQRVMNMGPVSRGDVFNELASEQNWRPTGRMRGSLSGRAYSAALNQLMIQPTQSAQAASPTPTPDVSSPRVVSPQLQSLIANNINSHLPAQQAYTRTGDTAGNLGARH